jgi:hypothetical protein
MISSIVPSRKYQRLPALLRILTVVLLLAPGAGAAQVEKFCFPGMSWGSPVVNDGTLEEAGWTGAHRYVFANGTGKPHGAIQAISDGTTLFVSVEANNDTAVNSFDAAVLGFKVGASPAKVLIVRLTTDNTLGDTPAPASPWRPEEVVFLTNGSFNAANATPWSWTDNGDPGWPMEYRSGGTGTAQWWFIEMAIPVAALGLPASGDFSFYASILRGGTLLTTVELPWPPGALTTGTLRNLPDPALWGNGNLDGAGCKGMFVGNQVDDIRVNGGLSRLILGPPATNSFSVFVHNTGSKDYDKIHARFFFLPFGISSPQWTAIPPPAGGWGPDATVSTGGQLLAGLPWTLSPAEATLYSDKKTCLRADLEQGSNANVPAEFVTRGGFQNMHFDVMSRFSDAPVVNTIGLRPEAGRSKVRVAVQSVRDALLARADGVSTPIAKGTPVAEFNWTVHGYQFTGKSITIGGQRLEILDPISSFGYVLQHPLAMDVMVPDLPPMDLRMRGGYFGQVQRPMTAASRSAVGFPQGTKKVEVGLSNFVARLDGLAEPDQDGLSILELEPSESRPLKVSVEYAECDKLVAGCCCRRVPTSSLGLVAFGLLAFAPRSRRREP